MRFLRRSVLAMAGVFLVMPVYAETPWKTVRVDAASLPAIIVPETRRPVPGGMPHALIAPGARPGDIGAA